MAPPTPSIGPGSAGAPSSGSNADDIVVSDEGRTLSASFYSAWSPPLPFYAYLSALGFDVEAYYFEPNMAFADLWRTGKNGKPHVNERYRTDASLEVLESQLPKVLNQTMKIVEQMRKWEAEQEEYEKEEAEKEMLEAREEVEAAEAAAAAD